MLLVGTALAGLGVRRAGGRRHRHLRARGTDLRHQVPAAPATGRIRPGRRPRGERVEGTGGAEGFRLVPYLELHSSALGSSHDFVEGLSQVRGEQRGRAGALVQGRVQVALRDVDLELSLRGVELRELLALGDQRLHFLQFLQLRN